MRPEPHFFYYTDKHNRGISWYESEWFSEYNNQKAVGERSSSYLYHEDSAIRIKKHLPNVKLVFVLRNPVERAWANYRYTVLSGLEDLSFEQALDQEHIRIKNAQGIWAEVQPHDYTGRSFYGRQLGHYLNYFPWNQILVISSEQLSLNPQAQVDIITKFLEVPNFETFQVPPSFTSLSVKDPKIQLQCRQVLGAQKFNHIVEAVRREETSLEEFSENSSEKDMIRSLLDNMDDKKQPIDPVIAKRLAKLFEEDQKKFFHIASKHIDFGQWL